MDKTSQNFSSPSGCTSSQQTSTAVLSAFFQTFSKTVRGLRVNETKVTSRNAFIVNLFCIRKWERIKKWERVPLSRLPADSWAVC